MADSLCCATNVGHKPNPQDPADKTSLPINNCGECFYAATAQKDILHLSDATYFNLIETSTTPARMKYLELTLTSSHNPTKAPHPLTNPQQTIKTVVNFPMHSR